MTIFDAHVEAIEYNTEDILYKLLGHGIPKSSIHDLEYFVYHDGGYRGLNTDTSCEVSFILNLNNAPILDILKEVSNET